MNFLAEYQTLLLGLVTGIIVAYLIIPPIVRVSHAKNLFAVTNGRTSHSGQVPLLGGVAIFAAVMIGTLLFMNDSAFDEFRYIFGGLLIVFFIGLKDDLINLGWAKKVIAEVIAALLVIIPADLRINSFHGLLGIHGLPYWFSVLFSLFVFIALINCFNLLDGIDGLASGMGIFIALVFGAWHLQLGFSNYALISFALAGGLITFFVFNVFGKKYKLFMGDTGSLLLGFIFSVLSFKILRYDITPEDPNFMNALPSVVMGLMIIPICDTIRVFTIRIIRGKSPFAADKTHLHHIFLYFGLTHLQASLVIILMNALIFGLAGMLRNGNPLLVGSLLFGSGALATMIPWYIALRKFQNAGK